MKRACLTAIGTAILVAASAATASAQLDPLLMIKRVPPNVIILVDTSMRMLEDGNGFYYDPRDYFVSEDTAVASVLGVPAGATKYRRKYKQLSYTSMQDSNSRFAALNIIATPNTDGSYATFYNDTRIEIAKRGIYLAAAENLNVRWGLIKMRQKNPAWRADNNCDKPVDLTSGENAALYQSGAKDTSPCSLGTDGKYGIFPPKVDDSNFNQTTAPAGTVIATPGGSTASAVMNKVMAGMYDSNGLIPAGQGTANYHDRPIGYMLEDAKAMLTTATTGVFACDAAATVVCRNTVVVLVTGGKNDGPGSYLAGHQTDTLATSFKTLAAGAITRRVPIYVVAIKPAAGDESDLRTIATNSTGQYYNVTNSGDVARVIDLAVQAGFSRFSDFQASKESEFTAVSPIIGTVILKGGRDISGSPLAYDEIRLRNDSAQAIVPQRSNVMITAGFALPGFDGRIRAFRTYVPVEDQSKPSGWIFTKDGTRLWPDLDGRPTLAGLARTPADPNARNIYTFIPNDSGGGAVVPFTTANADTLRLALNVSTVDTAKSVIDYVRARPLGAVIGSTPALMDPPSLDPPPDEDYGRPDHSAETFAGRHTDRRAIIFVGANDGMMHAIDARTGYEIWAFIPYNLMPKLRTLLDGQPVEQFDYFVDSSPKIAEVKMNTSMGTHEWRSLLIFGEGPGGTFYQALDVTEAGMNVDPTADDIGAVNSLLSYFDAPSESIKFLWSFPRYSSFNPNVSYTIGGLSDATPGGRIKVFGDLKSTASYAEKTVGFTWSDPAVGPLDGDRNVNAVMVGSGYFPDIEGVLTPGRGGAAPKAGHAFYLINVDNGTLLGNASGGSCSGTGCIDVGDVGGTTMKNALQADPSAAGDNGVPIVKKAYVGDLDGKYWRFDFGPSGSISSTPMLEPGGRIAAQPIFSSSALLFVGSADVYMFFSTGSDLLPGSVTQGTGAFQLYALKDNYPAAGATVKFTKALAAVTNTGGNVGGERPSTAPSVAGDIVFYTTNVQNGAAPCSDFISNLYAFTYLGGAAYDSATDADAKLGNNESPLVQQVAGRATAPFIVDQHLYFGTSGADGVKVEAFGDPDDFNNGVGQIGVRILSWREIRWESR